MVFSKFLKGQFSDYVDTYRQQFRSTISTCIGLTGCFMIGAGILFAYSNSLKEVTQISGVSILNYMHSKFSLHGDYNFVDAILPLFIFFITLFSLAGLRRQGAAAPAPLLKAISIKDVLALVLTLVIAIVADVFMAYLEQRVVTGTGAGTLFFFGMSVMKLLRIFFPQLLFCFTLGYQANIPAGIFFQRLLPLFAAMWLFNEVAHSFLVLVQSLVFHLVLAPLPGEVYFIVESILGIPLLACCFLGFYSTYTYWIIPPANDTDWDILKATPVEAATPVQPRF